MSLGLLQVVSYEYPYDYYYFIRWVNNVTILPLNSPITFHWFIWVGKSESAHVAQRRQVYINKNILVTGPCLV